MQCFTNRLIDGNKRFWGKFERKGNFRKKKKKTGKKDGNQKGAKIQGELLTLQGKRNHFEEESYCS